MFNLLAMEGAALTITVIVIVVVVLVAFSLLLMVLTRYKKCPSDKVMVIYGKISRNKDGTVLHLPRFDPAFDSR